ncbi:hypothetical protein [Bythopirellula polymerisocia]|uniref:Uncharacterized protein n=1 Tax=Bythopirellula polymerisocia TaxID=2528003 RepID=A0A5C6D0W2_9BACT|nr:hypothetical protein [Bythopirellula polymerisocia]TWU28519.1 hypothetical protein Pla144_18090 [Bythopirellula polymerisocia]
MSGSPERVTRVPEFPFDVYIVQEVDAACAGLRHPVADLLALILYRGSEARL